MAYGLVWERHYAALSSVIRADLTGWWITGYDTEGFPQASIHIQDAADPGGLDIAEPLAEQVLALLTTPVTAETP